MIEKIYSRKRIKFNKNNELKNNLKIIKMIKIIKIIIILAIAFSVVYIVIKGINPIFNKLAEERAKGIATEITNIETSKVLKNIKYEELINIERDSSNNIQMLRADVIRINELASDITYNIQIELKKKTSDKILIPFGSISGIKYLSGFGPKIKIKINPVGSIETNFVSSFETAGINQTIHRLFFEVKCKVSIVTPYDVLETEILNQILLGESVIVGDTPQTFLNLEGK